MRKSSIVQAALVGLCLVVAAPAQAASFGFGFSMGDGYRLHHPLFCVELTDHAIRAAVKAQGYHNIYLNVADNHRIQVKATKGDWVYLLRVSTCTGAILDRVRLKPA